MIFFYLVVFIGVVLVKGEILNGAKTCWFYVIYCRRNTYVAVGENLIQEFRRLFDNIVEFYCPFVNLKGKKSEELLNNQLSTPAGLVVKWTGITAFSAIQKCFAYFIDGRCQRRYETGIWGGQKEITEHIITVDVEGKGIVDYMH